MTVPSAVVKRFAADPIGPWYTFEKEAANAKSPIRLEIEEFLSSIPSADVAETQCDPGFRHLHPASANMDRAARIWIAWQKLTTAIGEYRLAILRQDSQSLRPRPYGHPALDDLTPDEEHLVPLRCFGFDGARLLRNGHAFLLLSSTGAPNAMHWLTQECYAPDVRDHMRVRLDPLLYGPEREFPALHQLMRVYGLPLNWDRIGRLHDVEHGRWYPDKHREPIHQTDYAWMPHGSEVTFVCEELPKLTEATCRPARYLHAIYQPSETVISHLDAAVRVYTASELSRRHSQHVRNVGKVGLRMKVLRCDEPLSRSLLSLLCQTFFVWNGDVGQYFRQGCK